MTDAELLDETEQRIIDGAALAEILRLLLLLGGRLDSENLRSWAKAELEGYGPDVEVPPSRTVGAPIYVDAMVGYNRITGQQISAAMLPDFASEVMEDVITMRQSISSIESMIDNIRRQGQEVATLSIPNWEIIAAEMDKAQEFQQITRMYRRVHVSTLESIVGDARNRAAELLGEFRRSSKSRDELLTGKQADAIVRDITVSGDGNSVVFSPGNEHKINASTGGSPSERGWWAAWGRVATIITVVAGVVAIVAWVLTSAAGIGAAGF